MADVRIVSKTACSCCGPGGAECRQKGGGAFLIGQGAFVPPAGPQPYYLSKHASGGQQSCTDCDGCGPGATCGSESCGFHEVWSGSSNINPTTGEETNDLAVVYNRSNPGTCDYAIQQPNGYFEFPCDHENTTCSQTTKTTSFSFSVPTACSGGSGECGTNSFSQAISITLSNPDSEANAITRLMNSAAWSEWGFGSCIAGWSVRTEEDGPNFAYNVVEWRVVKSGLLPSTLYKVDVPFYRRVYGVGSYALYATDTEFVMTDPAGNLAVSGEVPNQQGYQTYAGTPVVTPA
jgi:hypothetical protein